MSRHRHTAAVVVLVAALMGAGAALQHARETRYPVSDDATESLYITSGKPIGYMTEGFHAVAADVYWIRAMQYYGSTKIRTSSTSAAEVEHADYRLLYPLLDITTTLDPQFNIAYRFGAIFLAEPRPAGAGRPDLAIALLQKGLKARPDKWEYMQDIGFVYYWWRHDFKTAASWFNRASNLPGAPWWLRSLAANTLTEGGDRRTSRQMWESIRETAEIDWLRRDAERRLLQLKALDDIDQIQAALSRGAVLRGAPLDPSGTPYEIVAGRVRLSPKSALAPLPDEPDRPFAPPQ